MINFLVSRIADCLITGQAVGNTVKKVGTANVTYKYNSDGIRYEKSVNGVVHKDYLNGSTITAETIVNGNDITYIEYFYDMLGETQNL